MTTEEEPPELPFDLNILSMVTGISLRHLERMYDGEILPDDMHLVRLRKVLDEEQVKWFSRHSRPEVTTIRSRKGTVPEGHVLMPYISSAHLQEGDLISYRPPTQQRGAYWVKVISVSSDDRVVIVETLDSEIRLMTGQPVRVARPKEIS